MGNLCSSSSDNDNISTLPSISESSLSQSNILRKAESLRREADGFQIQATKKSEESQYQYHHGSRSEAKRLSMEKTALYERRDNKNREAAELIFAHYNQAHPADIIDLHGLYVAEALKYLQRKVDDCHSKNISQLKVITGIGNNSLNKLAKIKPAVENFASKNGFKVNVYDGCVVLQLITTNQ